MGKKHTLDKLHGALFEGKRNELTPFEQAVLSRYEACFVLWLEKPWLSDTELRDYLMAYYALSQAQAYRDIANLKVLLGNVGNAARAWNQYKVNALLDRAVAAADSGDHHLAKSLTNIAKEVTRANRLNLVEAEELPYDEIVPLPIEPVNDPSTAGFTPLPDLKERIRKLKQKYDVEVQDVDFTELTAGDEGN